MAFVLVVAGFVILLLFNNFRYINSYILVFFMFFLGIIYLWLLGIPFINVHGIWAPIHAIFNVCNFSIMFFILFSSYHFLTY